MTNPNKKQKNQYRKYLQLSGIGIQMGITIYLGAFFGKKLDTHYQTDKTFTLIFVLFALVASIWSLITQLKKINDKYD